MCVYIYITLYNSIADKIYTQKGKDRKDHVFAGIFI